MLHSQKSMKGGTRSFSPLRSAPNRPTAAARSLAAKKSRPHTDVPNEKASERAKRVTFKAVITSCVLLSAPSFAAEGKGPFYIDNGNIVVSGEIGLADIRAQEFVYWKHDDWHNHKVSQLDWKSIEVTLLTVGVSAPIDKEWSLKSRFDVGIGGDGHLLDRDWVSKLHDSWSGRAVMPDTDLDHYFAGSIEVDRIVGSNETGSLAVGAGLRYTDVKWTAYGGYGIESSGDPLFRDRHEIWSGNRKVISNRQKIPVGFVSLSGEQVLGDLSVSGGIRAGLSIGFEDIDDHWGEHRTYSDLYTAPTMGADIAVSYAVTPCTSLYLRGSFDRVFHTRGDEESLDTDKGQLKGPWKDSVAATFQAMSVSLGLKATF
ncbi:omptin family outer membrane protease [Mesorhizobium dulcispinae]|uniref:omptin family outer membrane protease n=1 Tax=Mesorhizobium dulcispinae TaxID=3072316 RepID=UPI002A23D427|nr:omptin family outer membrane protease [Mesorhizobium sp. VK23D]MDX8522028.1 omptin family outer membrane protease [Mesorhizobium sp. VK23D]